MNELFGSAYEILFYSQGFSNDLYQNGLYFVVGLVMVFSCLGAVGLYYYAIDHPGLNRWYHWLLVLGVVGLVNGFFAHVYTESVLLGLGRTYSGGDYFSFALTNAFLAVITFTLLSFILRWWSTNCDKTPIPQ